MTDVTRNTNQAEYTEHERIKLICAGKTELYRYFVEENKDRVYAMIQRQIHSHEVAEELAQETFLKAYRNLHTFRSDATFSTWIIRIALNTTYSYFRSRRYKEYLHNEPLETVQLSTTQNTEHDIETREQLKQFRKCYAKLTQKFQETISLCGLQEKTYEEAAKIIEVPIGTVRSRLNKARLILRDCMTKHHFGEAL